MQQEQTKKAPQGRKNGEAVAASDRMPCRMAHPLADWLNAKGDLDDFIFYNEPHRPSTR